MNVLFWLCSVVALVLNVLQAVISVYQSAQNFTAKIISSSVNAAKFGALARQIMGEFIKDPCDREDALSLHNHILNRFNELETEKPFLREESKTLWQKQVENMGNNPSNYGAVIKLPSEFREENHIMDRSFNIGNKSVNIEEDMLIDVGQKNSMKKTNKAENFLKNFM